MLVVKPWKMRISRGKHVSLIFFIPESGRWGQKPRISVENQLFDIITPKEIAKWITIKAYGTIVYSQL